MKKSSAKNKIILATLQLAAKNSWAEIKLDQIAKAAKVSLAETKTLFPRVDAIPPAIVDFITDEVLGSIGKPDTKAPIHDRLFEVMMARFDLMQPHRRGIIAIAESCRKSPPLAATVLQRQGQAMHTMLTAIGLDASPLHVLGLLMVYHFVFCTWVKDDQRDMAKTMAKLDRSLRQAGRIGQIMRARS